MVQSLSWDCWYRLFYLLQKLKIQIGHDEYTEHSEQREDGDENLVASSAGNSLGSKYLDDLYHFHFIVLKFFIYYGFDSVGLAGSLVNQGQWPRFLKEEDAEDYENNERDPENDRSERSVAFGKDIGSQRSLLSSSYHAKAINELDLSECAKCSPSYRLLPKDVSVSSTLMILFTILQI